MQRRSEHSDSSAVPSGDPGRPWGAGWVTREPWGHLLLSCHAPHDTRRRHREPGAATEPAPAPAPTSARVPAPCRRQSDTYLPPQRSSDSGTPLSRPADTERTPHSRHWPPIDRATLKPSSAATPSTDRRPRRTDKSGGRATVGAGRQRAADLTGSAADLSSPGGVRGADVSCGRCQQGAAGGGRRRRECVCVCGAAAAVASVPLRRPGSGPAPPAADQYEPPRAAAAAAALPAVLCPSPPTSADRRRCRRRLTPPPGDGAGISFSAGRNEMAPLQLSC